MPDVTRRYLYGAADGTWTVLETAPGLIAPSSILIAHRKAVTELDRLGTIQHVITALITTCTRRAADVRALHGRRHLPVQRALADLLGTHQQRISQYGCGLVDPRFTDAQYRALVTAHFNPHLLVAHLTDLHRRETTPTVGEQVA
jgi:hypothetical protein